MVNDVLTSVRNDLRQSADEKTREGSVRYFKEKIVVYGVKSALVGKIAARYYPEISPLGKARIFELCEDLWKSDYMEEAFIAANWSYRLHKEYIPDDFARFEKWVSCYVDNWAKCDTLCNHTIGSLVEQYPQFISNLKQWARSENRWMRRASAVTLIVPAKRGKFLEDIFEIADILLKDPDDLVRKGYGWLLKDAAIQHQMEIFDYVLKNKAVMPRTALRYAIERLPDDLKRRAMALD